MEGNTSMDNKAGPKKGSLENLTQEELVSKCRGLLNIAQKAQQAKNEAQSEVQSLQKSLETTRSVVVKLQTKEADLQRQLEAGSEIVTVLTEQKLKAIMELDEARKARAGAEDRLQQERIVMEENLRTVRRDAIALGNEAESYRRRNERLEKENEDLLKRLDQMAKSSANEKGDHVLLDTEKIDLEKVIETLNANNEKMKLYCSQISEERRELEEQLEEAKRLVEIGLGEKNMWYNYLTNQFNLDQADYSYQSWADTISRMMDGQAIGCERSQMRHDNATLQDRVKKLIEENRELENELERSKSAAKEICESKVLMEEEKKNSCDEKLILQNEVDRFAGQLKELMEEKDGLLNELFEVKQSHDRTVEELKSVNSARDQVLAKLEDVRIETRQLIENSEKLTEEINVLKLSKTKLEEEFDLMNGEHRVISQELDQAKFRIRSTSMEYEMVCKSFECLMDEKQMILHNFEILQKEKSDIALELDMSRKSIGELTVEVGGLKKQLEKALSESKLCEEKLEMALKEGAVIASEYEGIKYEKDHLNTTLSGALSEQVLAQNFARDMSKENTDLKNVIVCLENDVRKYISESENSVAVVERYKKELDQVQRDNEACKEILNVALAECDSLRLKNNSSKEQLERLSVEKQLLEDKKNRQGVSGEKDGVNNLEVGVMKIQNKCLDLQFQCDWFLKEISDKLNMLGKKFAHCQDTLCQKSIDMKVMTDELDMLRLLKIKQEHSAEEASQLRRILENMETELRMKNEELIKLTLEQSEEKEKLEMLYLNENHEKLEEECKNLQMKLENEAMKGEEISKVLENVETELQLKNKELIKITLEQSEDKEKLEKLSSNSNENHKKLEEECKNLQMRMETEVMKNEEMSKVWKREKTSLGEENRNLIELKVILEEKLFHTGNELTKLEESSTEDKEYIEHLNEEVNCLKSQFCCENNSLRTLKNEMNMLEQTLTHKTGEVNMLKESVYKLERSMAEHVNINQQLRVKLAEAEELLNLKCDEANRFNNETKEMESYLEEAKLRVERLETEVENCQMVVRQKSNELNTVNKELYEIKETGSVQNKQLLEELKHCKQLVKTRMEEQNRAIQEVANVKQAQRDNEERLSREIETYQELVRDKSEDIERLNRAWAQKLGSVIVSKVRSLKKCQQELKDSMEAIQSNNRMLTNLQVGMEEFTKATLASGKQEVADLLTEMQNMNQVLKQRGESISKLKEALKEADIREQMLADRLETIEGANAELASVVGHLESETAALREQLKGRDVTIRELEAELSHGGKEPPADVDALSTSTISRADECARLKDIEDSFEDRYAKLKSLAVKLKKRVSELQHQLELERNKMAAERSDLHARVTQLSSAAMNSQKMQAECDHLADVLERERVEAKALRAECDLARLADVRVQQDMAEAKATEDRLQADLAATVRQRNALEEKLASMREELESVRAEAMAQVETKRRQGNRELTALQERHKATLQQLELVKMQARKQSVLSLEMQDYERSAAELTSQLASERARVVSLTAELEASGDTRDSLREQISLLEERLATEEARSSQLVESGRELRARLAEADSGWEADRRKNGELRDQWERERAASEALTMQLATVSAEGIREREAQQLQHGALLHQVGLLETELASMRERLSEATSELARAQEEFAAYKVRAQSVLKSREGDGVGGRRGREEGERVDRLQESCDKLRQLLTTAESELEVCRGELSGAVRERDTSEMLCEKLKASLAAKVGELERQTSEARAYKLSSETLIQCYKKQLEEKEMLHRKVVGGLEDQLTELRIRLKQGQVNDVGEDVTTPSAAATHGEVRPASVVTPQIGEGDTPVVVGGGSGPPLLLVREAAEGSESSEPSASSKHQRRSSTTLVPLDKLLSSSTAFESDGIGEGVSARLEVCHLQLRHLTALLSEAERDSARLDQLNGVLKEEIRRLQRAIERQPHVLNTEYLKNIIFKFVTLQSGDERSRLVPVLDTMLKLSPEESRQLASVAKGAVEQSSGWSGYLPSWS